jgi:hypothetical protein
MVLKDLMRGTNFSIGISSNSKWILNENYEKLLCLKFNRICYNFNLKSSNCVETWTRELYLNLVTNSIHGEEFQVQTRNFLTWMVNLNQV